MNVYLFRPDVFNAKYNCSGKTVEEWYTYGERHEVLGIFALLMGVSLQILYFPFICTMLLPQFIENSCYKMMFFLGISDFITIYAHITSGYLSIVGGVYCTHRNLIYFIGSIGLATWCTSCITCIILTFNRCVDIYFPHTSRMLFRGWRTWLWICIPFGVFLEVSIFEVPVAYQSKFTAWFFNPFFEFHDVPYSRDPWYHSILHSSINIITVIALMIGNSVLCYYVVSSSKKITTSSKLKRQFLFQVCIISMLTLVCASIYVYMQFLYTPKWVILFASVAFMWNSGILALVYLFMNATLRRAAWDLFVKQPFGLGKTAQTSEMSGIHKGRVIAVDSQGGASSEGTFSKY